MSYMHNQFRFIQIVEKSLRKKRKIISFDSPVTPEIGIECYTSFFRYDESINKHYESNYQSLGGFKGDCYSDWLPIDIDRKDLLEAKNVAIQFIQFLEQDFEVSPSNLRIFFSGSKGFHIEIPTALFGDVQPSSDLPSRFKQAIQKFGNWDFDLSLYQTTRLYRAINSFNKKSNLYKIYLSWNELKSFSIDEIKALAKAPRGQNNFIDPTDVLPNQILVHLWDEISKPSNPIRSIQTSRLFLKKGVPEGNRNNLAFQNALKLKRSGESKSNATSLLLDWNNLNTPPLPENEIQATVNSAYSYVIDSQSEGILAHIRNDSLYKSLNTKERVVYLHILSHINTSNKSWEWGQTTYGCSPGQMICSYRRIADQLPKDISESTVRTVLKKLEKKGRIILEDLRKKRGTRLTLNDFIFENNHAVLRTLTPMPQTPINREIQ